MMASDWTKPIVAAVVASIAGASGGAGGTYALINHRLDQLETRLAEADSREQSEAWGALVQRLGALESRFEDRAGDDKFQEWLTWRINTDAKMVGIEVDIKDLRNRAP